MLMGSHGHDAVAPVWGRGLKFADVESVGFVAGRPRMGAWIEIPMTAPKTKPLRVAPVWGRGLK